MLLRSALFSTLIALAQISSATAAINAPAPATTFAKTQSHIIPVHSRQSAHDVLHDYGFDRVTYRRTRYDYDDRPVYIFTACRGHKRFRLAVNWHGELVRKRRKGFCRATYY